MKINLYLCFPLLQILPDGDLKPQGKHLQTRADYLMKVLRKQVDATKEPAVSVSVNCFYLSNTYKDIFIRH